MAINLDSFNSTLDVGEIYLALRMQLHSWDSIENEGGLTKRKKKTFLETRDWPNKRVQAEN